MLHFFKKPSPAAIPVTGWQNFAFPQPAEPHLATVKDRVRNSGLTSVRFIDDTRLIAGDFAAKCLFLFQISPDGMSIIDRHDSVIATGEAVETDLIDYHAGQVITSNFYQGTFSLYEIQGDKIVFLREIAAGGPRNMHGLRFVPGAPHLVWLTFCNAKNPCHIIYDLRQERVLHSFKTEQQCQDVAFANGHAVVFARTDHISKGTKKLRMFSKKRKMFATAYVYKLPENLETDPPVFVSEWRGEGHIDASVECGPKQILSANQYLDRVDVFSVSDQGQLNLSGVIRGFALPHGLDSRGGKVAVTNYGDQSLTLIDCPV